MLGEPGKLKAVRGRDLDTNCNSDESPPSITTQLLAILGEQFIVGNEICGAVISVRPNEDIIALWNRTASNPAITGRIRYIDSCVCIHPHQHRIVRVRDVAITVY